MNVSHARRPGAAGLAIAWVVLLNIGLLAIGVTGCRPADEIRTYRVAKDDRPAAMRTAAEPTHRMLAAIVPIADQAWFFKVVGTTEQMEQSAPAINDFFEQLTTGDDGQLTWKLPDAWQEETGNEMRLATIAIPAGDDSIELTVSKLGWTGDGPAGLLANVNRWRGQMQLPAVGPAGLADCTSALEVAGSDATLVDLSGQFSSGSMTPPFASQTMPSGHPPIAADGDLRDSGTNDGDTRSPVSGDTNIDAAGIRLETPTGWQSLPAQGMRKANFVIRDSERVAEVTVTDFRNAPGTSMADPLANANRWLGQLGRSPVGAGDLDALTESIEIDGHSGTIFTLESDAAADRPTGMTVAMVVVDEMVWFFKMLGDRDLVAAEGERFRALLDSVEFK